MEQLKLTKSEKFVYSYMNVLVEYLEESPDSAAQELLDIITPDDSEFMLDDELVEELCQTNDIAQMAKMLVSKYPLFEKEETQDVITKALKDSDILERLHDAFIEAMSKEHRYYFKEVELCKKDDEEIAYCTFTLPKPHTFHLVDEDRKIKTKVLNFFELDFRVGRNRRMYIYDYESDLLEYTDYMWLIDAVPTFREGVTEYYFCN